MARTQVLESALPRGTSSGYGVSRRWTGVDPPAWTVDRFRFAARSAVRGGLLFLRGITSKRTILGSLVASGSSESAHVSSASVWWRRRSRPASSSTSIVASDSALVPPNVAGERQRVFREGVVPAEPSNARQVVIRQRRHTAGEVVLAVTAQHVRQSVPLDSHDRLRHVPRPSLREPADRRPGARPGAHDD